MWGAQGRAVQMVGREDVVPFENGLETVGPVLSGNVSQNSERHRVQEDGDHVSFLRRPVQQVCTHTPHTVIEDLALNIQILASKILQTCR